MAGVGTGGTVTGVGEYLKSQNPAVKVVAVEPAASPVLSGGASGPHKIQGIGAGFVPGVLNTKIYDEIIPVETTPPLPPAKRSKDRRRPCGNLLRGGDLGRGRACQKTRKQGKIIVALLADTGERYLSTPLFAE